MDNLSSNPYERGRQQAQLQHAQHGPRRLQQLVERAALAGFVGRGVVTRHHEFWRGFRNEAAALTAIASRRATRS